MATVEPQLAPTQTMVEVPSGWKRRLEDPFNTYYRYPLAASITRLLIRTPITPNQVSLVQPGISAVAGYLLTFNDWRYHVAAAIVFEIRSILDCVDGSLARAKKLASPNGHAIDALADWLGVVFLYCGIIYHVVNNPAPGFSSFVSFWVAGIALWQGAVRSMASDYFKNKYISIFERRRDELPEQLLSPAKPRTLFGRADRFIAWSGHLFFNLENFNRDRSRPLSPDAVKRLIADEDSPRTRLIAFLWSISSGDAFLSFVIVSILLDRLWAGQLFFATFGTMWILALIGYNVAFFKSYRRAASQTATVPPLS